MKFGLFRKKNKINVPAINLKFRGELHSVGGVSAESRIFSVTVPFTNRPYANSLTEAEIIKPSDFEPISLKGIQASQPFKVLAVEPALPRKITSEERAEFKISIEGPDYNYSGPLTLEFLEENREFVHLEISKVLLNGYGKSVEAESTLNMLNVPKNHIFQQNLQLMKLLSYGLKVERISVDKPFEFEGSLPKLPFVINDAGSFVLSIYIKAPEENYAGPLVVTLY